MSHSYHLVCPALSLQVLVGQGWKEMSGFYSGEPDVMVNLHRFLQATYGHPVQLMRDQQFEGESFTEVRGDTLPMVEVRDRYVHPQMVADMRALVREVNPP